MTSKLTKSDLDAIREREDKATAGPWNYDGKSLDIGMIRHMCRGDGVIPNQHNDNLFVSCARTDIPALLELVEELTEALELLLNGEIHIDVVTGDFTLTAKGEKVMALLKRVRGE